MEVTDEEEDMEIWESLELHLDAVEPRGKIPTPLTATLGGVGWRRRIALIDMGSS